MTKQEMFNKIYEVFFIKQTLFSIFNNNSYYNSDYNGVGCPVGILVKPYEFKAWTEGLSITRIMELDSTFNTIVKTLNFELLCDLQDWHDNCDKDTMPHYVDENDRQLFIELLEKHNCTLPKVVWTVG